MRRSWSSASSCVIASGMASSQRGFAGTLLPGSPSAGVAGGRRSSGYALRHVSKRRSECKVGRGPLHVVHKGGYGTVSTGDEPNAGTGGRGAHTGRPQPGARADQDGPHP